jgi:hypothetical protein
MDHVPRASLTSARYGAVVSTNVPPVRHVATAAGRPPTVGE